MAGKRPNAPAGCFWRSNTSTAGTRIKGRLVVWSLRTSDPIATERRKIAKERMIADVFHGDAKRDFVEVLELWAVAIDKQVGVLTVRRYASSLNQLRFWLDGKGLSEIDSRSSPRSFGRVRLPVSPTPQSNVIWSRCRR